MAAKIKSILVLIGVFLIYWFGVSFTTGFLYNVFSSFVLSVFAAELIFSFPFLYVMFRKSKIALIGEETVNEKTCPWWVLLGLGLAIASNIAELLSYKMKVSYEDKTFAVSLQFKNKKKCL